MNKNHYRLINQITKKYTAIKKDTKLKNPCILIRQTNPHPYEIAESEEIETQPKWGEITEKDIAFDKNYTKTNKKIT